MGYQDTILHEFDIDLKAKNTITLFDDWVKEVQRLLNLYFDIQEDSFMCEVSKDSQGSKGWKTMFSEEVNAAAMAWYIFTLMD